MSGRDSLVSIPGQSHCKSSILPFSKHRCLLPCKCCVHYSISRSAVRWTIWRQPPALATGNTKPKQEKETRQYELKRRALHKLQRNKNILASPGINFFSFYNLHSDVSKDFIDQKRDEKDVQKVWSDISVYYTINRADMRRSCRWYTIHIYSVPTTTSPHICPVDGVVHRNIGSDFLYIFFVSLSLDAEQGNIAETSWKNKLQLVYWV